MRRSNAVVVLVACIAASIVLGASERALADDGALRWSPGFRRFTTLQYGLTAGIAGSLWATNQWLRPADDAGWRGDLLLDHEARSFLSARSETARSNASSISDALVLGLVAYPFAIDTVLVAGGVHQSYDVAFQMGMLGLQAVLTAKLITALSKNFIGRARPDSELCVLGDEANCSTRNQSFVSGHASQAFVGAGLICAHHQNLPLYGDGPLGAITCGLSLSAATVVGALRIVADRHHLSDVLSGAAVGLTAGYLLPNLLSYDFGNSRTEHAQLAPFVERSAVGLLLRGEL